MKKRIVIFVVGLVVAAMMASPASAQDPEPASVPTDFPDPEAASVPGELEKSGVVTPFGAASATMEGEDEDLSTAPDLSAIEGLVTDELTEDADRDLSTTPNSYIRLSGRTWIRRYGYYGVSRGTSRASRRIHYIRTGNYLCRYRRNRIRCTTWTFGSCRSCSIRSAGWRWRYPYRAWWYSRSQHRFRHGWSTRQFYSRYGWVYR